MNDWKKYRLEELKLPGKGNFVSGPFGSNISSKYFVDDGVPVIRGNNLTKDSTPKFIDDGYVYITHEKAHELRNCLAIENDIIFTAAGTLGQIGVMPNNLKYKKYIISNKQIRFRSNLKIVDPIFLYYYLINPQMRVFIEQQNKGSSIPLLTLGSLKWIPIYLPHLSTQQKIAKILSSYDDLIENNLKRIKLLEEFVRLTYEEWFLRFRIGDKKLNIDSNTNLPFEWKNVLLADYIDLERGIEPGNDAYEEIKTDSNIPFLRVGNLSKRSSKIYVSKTLTDNKIVNESDILISLDGSPGMVKFGMYGSYSTGIRKAKSKQKNISNIFIFNLLNSQYIQKLIEAHSSGTTILHAGSSVKKMNFSLPTNEVLDMYNKTEIKKFQLILNLLNKNKILKESRDILLPRLLTGMIDIEKIDVAT